MKTIKVSFPNKHQEILTGRLEMSIVERPKQFALFIHCFTCNKNLNAVKQISRSLAKKGIGVLRFDFTGLGESEGDFSDTNFSGNIDDIISAAKFLETHYKAPSLIVGHSFGGTASIYAGHVLDSVKAIATIGSPSRPEHVKHLFKNQLDTINTSGVAEVNIGGRPFSIKKQFIDDLEHTPIHEIVGAKQKALLVLHSPSDQVVELKNAEEIYNLAKHPKSFISLDGADHLLTNKIDAEYASEIISSWVTRYIQTEEEKTIDNKAQVNAQLISENNFTTKITAGKHHLIADEPKSIGGKDLGPAPYELVSSGLAACTVMTLQMYAQRKQWPLERVDVHINHEKALDEDGKKIDVFEKEILIYGDLTEKQKERLHEISKKCPVHKTLSQSSILK